MSERRRELPSDDRLRLIVALAAICGVGFALRLVWGAWAHTTPSFENDGGLYFSIARSLAHGDSYRSPFGTATAYLPPAYPGVLAVALKLGGEARFASVALNASLAAAAMLALYYFASSGLRRGPALVTVGLFALLPSQIMATGAFYPDAVFAALLLVALGLYVRSLDVAAWRALPLLAGLLIGAATLAESQLLLFPILLAMHAAFGGGQRGRRIAITAGGLVGGAVIVVAPWCVANVVRVGDVGPVATNGGVAFWIGHHDGATGQRTPLVRLRESVAGDDLVAREVDTNRAGYRDGASYALRHPVAEFTIVWKNGFWMFADDEEWLLLNDQHGTDPLFSQGARDNWLTLCNVYYYALLTLAVLGVVMMRRRRSAAMSVALVFAVYWILVHLAFFGDQRFHTALLPIATLFASVAVCSLFGARRSLLVATVHDQR